jgi:hypothetical protein
MTWKSRDPEGSDSSLGSVAGQVDPRLLQQADHLRRHRASLTAQAAELTTSGKFLRATVSAIGPSRVLSSSRKRIRKTLAALVWPVTAKHRFLADVLGLVRNPFERIENAEVGEEILDAEVLSPH